MIVQRITSHFQPGKAPEALQLFLAEVERYGTPHSYRAYRPYPDTGDKLCGEYEFETMSELEQFWKDWQATPEAQAFSEKWNPLLAGEDTYEMWETV